MTSYAPKFIEGRRFEKPDFSPSEQEVSQLLEELEIELKRTLPRETKFYLFRLIRHSREELYQNDAQNFPNQSSQKAMLDKAEKALQEVYDLFGEFEPVSTQITDAVGIPERQIDIPTEFAIREAQCSEEFKMNFSEFPVYKHFCDLQKSAAAILLAVSIARENMSSVTQAPLPRKKRAEIRRDLICNVIFNFEKNAQVKPSTYENGATAKILRSLSNTIKMHDYPSVQLLLPNEIKPVIIDATTVQQPYSNDFYSTFWGKPSPWEDELENWPIN